MIIDDKEMQMANEIEQARSHGYREGRLGGDSIPPMRFERYTVLRDAWYSGYTEGSKAREGKAK